METLVNVWSDAAMLAMFDPEVCLDLDPRQTGFPFHGNAGVKSGRFALISLPGDGVYPTLITDSDLSPDQAARVHHSVRALGCEVVSGRLYVTGMDLPGVDADLLDDSGAGAFVSVPIGSYLVDVHLMKASAAETPTDAAVVVILRRRFDAFIPVTEDPRLLDVTDEDIERIKAEVEAEHRAKR